MGTGGWYPEKPGEPPVHPYTHREREREREREGGRICDRRAIRIQTMKKWRGGEETSSAAGDDMLLVMDQCTEQGGPGRGNYWPTSRVMASRMLCCVCGRDERWRPPLMCT